MQAVTADPLPKESASALEVKIKLATQKILRAQTAEQQVGIGDCRLSAFAVTDRARIGSSGFGTDAQGSAGIDAGQRPSACADGVNVEHRHTNRQSGYISFRSNEEATFEQRYISRCPAHVEGNDVLETGGAPHFQCSDGAPGGARKNGTHRFYCCSLKCSNSAARLHYENLSCPRA